MIFCRRELVVERLRDPFLVAQMFLLRTLPGISTKLPVWDAMGLWSNRMLGLSQAMSLALDLGRPNMSNRLHLDAREPGT